MSSEWLRSAAANLRKLRRPKSFSQVIYFPSFHLTGELLLAFRITQRSGGDLSLIRLSNRHHQVQLRVAWQMRHVALVDRAQSQFGAKRQVTLTLPFFVPAIFAIAQTHLILTVPRRLAKLTAAMAGVRVVEAPREIKSFPYFMAWHPRLTNEPAHKWFREQLRSAVRTA
jgi:DNA-binding transcriptional LysR family regulator